MHICPVCEMDFDGKKCERCGFDISLHYEVYGSLTRDPLGQSVVSTKRAEWIAKTRDCLRCVGCGGLSFSFIKKTSKLCCLRCEKEVVISDGLAVERERERGRRLERSVEIYEKRLKNEETRNREYISKIAELERKIKALEADLYSAIASKNDDSQACVYGNGKDYSDWKISAEPECFIAISAGNFHAVALRKNGKVVPWGRNDEGQCSRLVRSWDNIIAVAAGGYHTVGLKRDGTVVAEGSNLNGCCALDKNKWKNVIAIAAGESHTVGLRSDGTVVAAGPQDVEHRCCEVDDWRDIVGIAAGNDFTVGLKKNGTVLVTPNKDIGEIEWNGVREVVAGHDCIVGLKEFGVPNIIGNNSWGKLNMSGPRWRNLLAFAVGAEHSIGLCKDGTVVVAGYMYSGQEESVSRWTDVVDVAVGQSFVMALRKDGEIMIAGNTSSKLQEIPS